MTARTKSAWLLFATLLVGMLIGALGISALQNRRMEQIRSTFDRRGGITDLLEEVIQPMDETQQAQIRAVLELTEARFKNARRECRKYYAASGDSMRTDLTPLLTPAQQTRLDEWLTRQRQPSRRGRSEPDGRRDGDRRDRSPRDDDDHRRRP